MCKKCEDHYKLNSQTPEDDNMACKPTLLVVPEENPFLARVSSAENECSISCGYTLITTLLLPGRIHLHALCCQMPMGMSYLASVMLF